MTVPEDESDATSGRSLEATANNRSPSGSVNAAEMLTWTVRPRVTVTAGSAAATTGGSLGSGGSVVPRAQTQTLTAESGQAVPPEPDP